MKNNNNNNKTKQKQTKTDKKHYSVAKEMFFAN